MELNTIEKIIAKCYPIGIPFHAKNYLQLLNFTDFDFVEPSGLCRK